MFMSVQNKPTQARPQTKIELAEAKLLKIKDNTKLMLEGKKSAQLKMEELKLKIVEESKAMKEKIRKADDQLNSNKTALKSVQANIKKSNQENWFWQKLSFPKLRRIQSLCFRIKATRNVRWKL